MSLKKDGTVPHKVEAYFCEQITKGKLGPGDRLPSERALQEKLQVSRFMLREGLARLNALGLIEVHHGRGTFISKTVSSSSLRNVLSLLHPDAGDTSSELLEARTLLEGELSALACLRQTPRELEKLERIIERSAGQLNDLEAFCLSDLDFHRAIAVMAKNQFLAVMHASLWEQIFDVMKRNAKTRKNRKEILGRHRKMLEALQSGEVKRVRELSEHFLSMGCRNYY
jgi:DNA-binding FadR family transcriptional regulator